MKWIRDNNFILALTLFALLILASPIIIFGVSKSFYLRLDTDIVFTTNALLFAKTRVISFFDHPGTPTIVLLSYTFIPLRLVAKYLLHQNFIQWSFDNYLFLTFYLRIFQLIISGSTLFLFLKLVEKVNKSKLVLLVSFLAVFSSGVLSWSAAISTEPLSLLLTVIWLMFFVKFVKAKHYRWLLLMSFVSGISLANKFTNLFLVIPTILLPIFIYKAKLVQKLAMIVVNLAVITASFIFGIWKILYNFNYILQWVRNLFLHAEKYGGGVAKVFDWTTYSSSVSTLMTLYPATFVLVALAVLFVGGLTIRKMIKKSDAPVIFLFFSSFLGFLIFSKYPTIHYNSANILLLFFCAIYFVSKLRKKIIKILVPILVLVFVFNSFFYFKWLSDNVLRDSNQSVNEVLETWTPYWASDIFRSQLDTVKNLK